jgi:hypothetical protein
MIESTVRLQVICRAEEDLTTLDTLIITEDCTGGGGPNCCALGTFKQVLAYGSPWSSFSGIYSWTETYSCSRILAWNVFQDVPTSLGRLPTASEIFNQGISISPLIAGSPPQVYDAYVLPVNILANPSTTNQLTRLNFGMFCSMIYKRPSDSSWTHSLSAGLSIHHKATATSGGGYTADNYPCAFPFYRPVDFVYGVDLGFGRQYSSEPFGTAECTALEMAIGTGGGF